MGVIGDRAVALVSQSVVPGSWRGVPLTRVYVTEAKSGAPRPPGVARLPQPGEIVLSPAAAALSQSSSGFARLVPGSQVGTIANAGLLGPDELYAYVGVQHDALRAQRRPVAGAYHQEQT